MINRQAKSKRRHIANSLFGFFVHVLIGDTRDVMIICEAVKRATPPRRGAQSTARKNAHEILITGTLFTIVIWQGDVQSRHEIKSMKVDCYSEHETIAAGGCTCRSIGKPSQQIDRKSVV